MLVICLGLLSKLFYCVAHIPILAVGNSSGCDAHLTCPVALLPGTTDLPDGDSLARSQLSPRLGHFPKELWVLWLNGKQRTQDLGTSWAVLFGRLLPNEATPTANSVAENLTL